MNAAEWYAYGNTASINGLEVFFRREGSGTPLLCIHGFPSSSWDFEALWSSLIRRFDVIAPDLVGLGKSAKPQQPLSVALQADMIETLLKQNMIHEAHILAHDLGDTVAQELLARKMDNTAKINWLSCVFLNGGIFPETHRPLFIQKLLISPLGSLAVHLMSEGSFRKNMIRIFSDAHPPSEAFLHETWQLILHNKGRSMIPRLIRYMKERSDFRTRWITPLEQNCVPLRLINGIEDPISGKHAADRYAEVVPKADLVLLENSGHYPHVESPGRVLDSFFEFHSKERGNE